jgi:hypothetical protein
MNMATPAVKGFPPRGVLVLMWLFLIIPLFPALSKTTISEHNVEFTLTAFAAMGLLGITVEYCRLYFVLTLSSDITATSLPDTPKLRKFDSCNVFGFIAFVYLMSLAVIYSEPAPNVASSWVCVGCVIVLYLLYCRVYKIYNVTLPNDSAK